VRWKFRLEERRIGVKAPFCVHLHFYYPMPLSWSAKKRQSMEGAPVTTRPDLDNYVKFMLDALEGYIWDNDSCVVQIHAAKSYSEAPRTELKAYVIE